MYSPPDDSTKYSPSKVHEDRDVGYLSVPLLDNGSDDGDFDFDEDYQKMNIENLKRSSNIFNRIVGLGALIILISIVSIYFTIFYKNSKNGGGDNDANQSCYVFPSCYQDDYSYDQITGFTNNTGWLSPSLEHCCNICSPTMNSTVCFDTGNPESSCKNKTGNQDYDYLLFDVLWLPQFCAALSEGHDPTLSHIYGSSCQSSILSSQPRLSIHGLWPNYYDGFPQCCNMTGNLSPLNPQSVMSWSIWPELQSNWFDPTTESFDSSNTACSTCYLLNHEWEKHGGCFSGSNAELYFSSGLSIWNMLLEPIRQINRMNGSVVATKEISDLFNKSVNVICDPQANNYSENSKIGNLLEIQICFNTSINTRLFFSAFTLHSMQSMRSDFLFWKNLQESFQMVDCMPPSTTQFNTPCPNQTSITNFQLLV